MFTLYPVVMIFWLMAIWWKRNDVGSLLSRWWLHNNNKKKDTKRKVCIWMPNMFIPLVTKRRWRCQNKNHSIVAWNAQKGSFRLFVQCTLALNVYNTITLSFPWKWMEMISKTCGELLVPISWSPLHSWWGLVVDKMQWSFLVYSWGEIAKVGRPTAKPGCCVWTPQN